MRITLVHDEGWDGRSKHDFRPETEWRGNSAPGRVTTDVVEMENDELFIFEKEGTWCRAWRKDLIGFTR
jgi:hypothetical protein